MFKVLLAQSPKRAAKIHLYLPNNQKSMNKFCTYSFDHFFYVADLLRKPEIAQHAKIHKILFTYGICLINS